MTGRLGYKYTPGDLQSLGRHCSMSKPFTDAWVDGPLSTKFYARTYEATPPAKAHVVFVHGFAEHVGRYEETFPGYASKGISVFAYDQRGFGRTACDNVNKSTASSWGVTSWKDQQHDIAFYILRERDRLGPNLPIFLMGHSMVRNFDNFEAINHNIHSHLSLTYCNVQCSNLGRGRSPWLCCNSTNVRSGAEAAHGNHLMFSSHPSNLAGVQIATVAR